MGRVERRADGIGRAVGEAPDDRRHLHGDLRPDALDLAGDDRARRPPPHDDGAVARPRVARAGHAAAHLDRLGRADVPGADHPRRAGADRQHPRPLVRGPRPLGLHPDHRRARVVRPHGAARPPALPPPGGADDRDRRAPPRGQRGVDHAPPRLRRLRPHPRGAPDHRGRSVLGGLADASDRCPARAAAGGARPRGRGDGRRRRRGRRPRVRARPQPGGRASARRRRRRGGRPPGGRPDRGLGRDAAGARLGARGHRGRRRARDRGQRRPHRSRRGPLALRRDAPRRHRAPSGGGDARRERSAPPAPVASRSAHRPRQPHTAVRDAPRGAGGRPRRGARAGAADTRPRRLQGPQRHLRAPRRRRGAAGARRAAHAGGRNRGHRRPAGGRRVRGAAARRRPPGGAGGGAAAARGAAGRLPGGGHGSAPRRQHRGRARAGARARGRRPGARRGRRDVPRQEERDGGGRLRLIDRCAPSRPADPAPGAARRDRRGGAGGPLPAPEHPRRTARRGRGPRTLAPPRARVA